MTGRNSAFLLALVSIAILSSNATVAILAIGGMSPLTFSLGATAATALVLGLLMPSGGWALAGPLLRQPWFLLAIALKVTNDVAFYYAVTISKEIEATIIVYLYPVFNAVLGGLLLGPGYQRLSRKEWVLFTLSFVSIVLLTPLGALSELSAWIFGAALLSAVASVYVVLVQVTADRIGAPRRLEMAVLGWLSFGNLALHVLVAAGWIVFFDGWDRLSAPPEAALPTLAGMIWIGVAVYWGSEALWLRASRIYNAISLKSLFYLSPALGACYLAFLGIDDLDVVVVFCLCGVIVSNYLLHQRFIDDLSFISFLFGLIGAAVVLRLAPADGIVASFHLSPDIFQTQITFVSIIAGFILFRALEVFQRCADAFQTLIVRVAAHPRAQADPQATQAMFDRLVVEPDALLWPADAAADHARTVLMDETVRPDFLRYFKLRVMGLSRPERFLMYLVCLLAVPSVLAQAVVSGNGAFVSAFFVGVFCFLPVLVDEQVSFRIVRPVVGVVVRRTLLAHHADREAIVTGMLAPRSVYLNNERMRTILFIGLTLVICAATWSLLEGA
ncbi:EamA family transporter [Jannaschia ovalis]|uniref:EamA family transporter n=1 Tax=Jannaschia ovalis TaxID=3038773 RepID=A0ABY8LIA2_9RHOB|nr:EamA family transporter [Jannaschia sp. GRR-S6-38]WGH79865.1 EamA family transporter [Jannaschia sp. GRR-S6-38]